MITVLVTYQVSPAFAEQNKKNIEAFLKDFKLLDTSAFTYTIYTKEDKVTFVHHSTYRDAQVQAEVLNVPSFREFQRWRDESGLNGTHKVEVLHYIGSAGAMLHP